MTTFYEDLDPPQGVTAGLLRGEIVMVTGPDLVHDLIVTGVQDRIPRERWTRIQTQDLDIAREAGEPVPDLVVAAPEPLPAPGRLLPASLVTMVVEVVSRTGVDRDHGVKRSIRKFGDPVHLPFPDVDPDTSRFGAHG